MKQSLVRYLLVSGAVALVVNVVINALVGWALYGAADGVPLTGDPSITGDTVVGAFLIGFFTILVVAPAARREARAGRVVGMGPRVDAWLPHALERRPVVGAIAGGIVVAAVAGGGVIATLVLQGVEGMAVMPFLGFKVGFAGVVGTVAAVAVARIAVASVGDAPADDRWCQAPDAPLGGPSYPCEYIDKGGIAVTSDAHGCSATPTWHLVVSGLPDPEAVRAALGDTVARYPSLRTRVQSLDGRPELSRKFRYAFDDELDIDDMFEVVDLRGRPESELDALIRDVWNRYLDQFREPPLSLTMAITGDASCRLLFRQHHGIADGRAFIELLADFASYLDARVLGVAPPAATLEPIHRRGELEALGLGGLTRARYAVAGFGSLLGTLARGIVRPTTPLVHNDSNDYTGANGTVHWVIDDAALEAWRPARKEMGASLNSMLTAALFLANQRWHRELGRELGRTNALLMMETRPRDGSFRSFANHLASLEATVDLGREQDIASVARAVQRQVVRQRDAMRPIKRMLCERKVVAGMPLDKLQKLVFESKRASFNLNFSNLISLPFPALGTSDWKVDEVLITTPVTPRNGIVLTVIRYRGRLCFNFNYAASAATREQTATLARHFAEVLESATGYAAIEVPTAAMERPVSSVESMAA